MDNVIKVALAGYGRSGQVFHAPFLLTDQRFSLLLVYEQDTDQMEVEYPGIRVVHSFEELLESDVDVIVLCVPNKQRAPMAEAAMRAGKTVVVEKPVTATVEDAQDIFAVARETGQLLAVYQNHRWDGGFLTAKGLLEREALGEVVEWETRFDRYDPVLKSEIWGAAREPGAGSIYDLGSHLIDQAVVLFGAPEAVWADLVARCTASAADDDFIVHLFYPGMRCTLRASMLAAEAGPHIMVLGYQGAYIKQLADAQERLLAEGARPGADWGKEPAEAWGNLSTVGENGTVVRCRVETERGNYGLFYDALYRTLVGGEPFPITEEQVFTVLKIIEACQESDRTGRTVRLECV